MFDIIVVELDIYYIISSLVSKAVYDQYVYHVDVLVVVRLSGRVVPICSERSSPPSRSLC